ncbi:MAG: hypothetical protein R2843_13010 [Thermomicrobiales bacterium]
MTESIRARGIIARTPNSGKIEEFIIDPPGAGEALVRIIAAGVCHTDLGEERRVRHRLLPVPAWS